MSYDNLAASVAHASMYQESHENRSFATMSERCATQRCIHDKLSFLPLELLLKIASYLPIPAVISSKLVNRALYHSMPTPTRDELLHLQYCARKAVRRAVNEQKRLVSGFKHCVFCDTLQSVRHFQDVNIPICSFHDKRFLRKAAPAAMAPETRARISNVSQSLGSACWVQLSRPLCAHCRAISGWEVEHCWCECIWCPKVEIHVFVRTPAGKDQVKSAEVSSVLGKRPLMIEARVVEKGAWLERGEVPILELEQPQHSSHKH